MRKILIFFVLVLSVTVIISLCSCSAETTPDPFTANVLYQTNNYSSNYIYAFERGYYIDIGAPEFMGISLFQKYEKNYLLLFQDLSMKYQEEPVDSIEGNLLENSESITKTQLFQYIHQADATLLQDWDQTSVSINYSCCNENGIIIIFSDTLNNSSIHIAEFDVTGILLRLVEVSNLRSTTITKYVVKVL